MLEYANPREHIEALYNTKRASSENTKTLAGLLDSTIHTVLQGGQKFIYELLQNADDAKASSVDMRLDGGSLMISHNGNHFKQRDVDRICNIATHNDDDNEAKTNQEDKTGYKGVGFKAVFALSKHVTVISEEYSFRFDKRHFGDEASELPWQIIPIPTDAHEYIDDDEENPDRDKVKFYLKDIFNVESCEKELELFINHPEVMLFLRNIQAIHLTINNGKTVSLVKEDTENGFIKISSANENNDDEIKEQYFLVNTRSASVPSSVKSQLKEIPDSICPKKLKNAEKIKIIFAAEVDVSSDRLKFIPVKNSRLYCYLPTEVEVNFSFLVNTDFILNFDRTHLIKCEWNNFLFEAIAEQQFRWLANIAKSSSPHKDLKNNVLQLLNMPKLFEHEEQDIVNSYEGVYLDCLKKTRFIPSIKGKRLSFQNCVIDETDISIDFLEYIQEPIFSNKGTSTLVSPHLEAKEKLLDIKKSQEYEYPKLYTWNNVVKNIERYVEINKDSHYFLKKIIAFLTPIAQKIKDKRILLTESGDFSSPKHIFIREENMGNWLNDWIISYNLPMLHELYQRDSLNILKNTSNVKPLTKESFVENYIYEQIDTKKVDRDNTVDFLRFIYRICKKEPSFLDKIDKKRLSQFPVRVKTNDRKHLANLSSSYWIKEEGGKRSPPNAFLHNRYIQRGDDDSVWDQLLRHSKIKTQIGLNFIASINYHDLEEQLLRMNSEEILEYYFTEQCSTELDIKQPKKLETEKGKATFKNFVFSDFLLENYQDVGIFNWFLYALDKDWHKLERTVASINRRLNRSLQTITVKEPFLSYFCKNFITFPVKGKTLKTSETFYHPALSKKYAPLLGTPTFDVELTVEQAQFIGFRTWFKPEEILQLISKNRNIRELKELYELLLVLDKIPDQTMVKWREDYHLLNWKGDFASIKALMVYDVAGMPKNKGQYIHPCGLGSSQLKKLGEIFGLPLYSSSQKRTFTPSTEKKQKAHARKIKKIIYDLLPPYIYYDAQYSGQNIEDHFQAIYEQFISLTFICCDEISDQRNYFVSIEHNSLYFLGRINDNLNEKIFKAVGEFLFITEQAQKVFESLVVKDVSIFAYGQELKTIYTHLNYADKEIEEINNLFEQVKVQFDQSFEANQSISAFKDSPYNRNSSSKTTLPASNNVNIRLVEGGVSKKLKLDNLDDEGLNTAFNYNPQEQKNEIKIIKLPTSEIDSNDDVEEPNTARQPMSAKERKRIGNKGERCAYEFFKEHYSKKPGASSSQNEDNVWQYFSEKRKKRVSTTIDWCNEEKETYQPRDIVVTKQFDASNEKLETIIEVKSTENNSYGTSICSISNNEWQHAKQVISDGGKYHLFRVYDLNSNPPKGALVKNFVAEFKDALDGNVDQERGDAKIKLDSIKFKLKR